MVVELVVAGGQATELFEACEEVFDEVAGAIAMAIEVTRLQAVATRRDDGFGTGLGDGGHQRVGIVAFVGNDRLRRVQRLEQWLCLSDVGLLGAGERERHGIAQGVGDPVQFRAPAATRPTQ